MESWYPEEGKEMREPVSPSGQYFNSSVLSVAIIGVLESQIPIDDSPTLSLLQDVFLPINPRFSSVMVRDNEGVKQWKRVEVKLKDHINIPNFPGEKSPEFYDECLRDYLSDIAMDQLPQSRPLWEIHIFKYPTSHAAGNVIFKLHHSLGDGFSLMGALLSCLQRADDPSLPLTFPVVQATMPEGDANNGICGSALRAVSGVANTVSDFGFSLLKSSLVEDARTPIRSGADGVEFRPINITTLEFSLDQIKQIKARLEVTINDVICGVIFMGTRLYMQQTNPQQRNATATALVLLNTRNFKGYKSVGEMIEPSSTDLSWGNRFGFLHVSIPELDDDADESPDPFRFIFKAQRVIQRKRNSLAVLLTGKMLEILRRFRGPEVTAKYIHSTLKNSSMTVSNVIGPVEKMALANHPVKGLYFMVVGVPQSLTITMISYMKKLRVAVGAEKGIIDPIKLKACIEGAFDTMLEAAVQSSTPEAS